MQKQSIANKLFPRPAILYLEQLLDGPRATKVSSLKKPRKPWFQLAKFPLVQRTVPPVETLWEVVD
jgi:hypothetical protein